jgi:polysaccharide biosynthesis protein PslG
MDFLEAFFSSGILAELDAVSVHPYRARSRAPETAAEDYRKLGQLIERYAPAPKKQMPILSGEWGYSSHSRGVSPETQAAFLARQQLSNLLSGVPLSVWYDWKDDGTNPDESEHHFGTMTIDLKPKPAYLAARTLTHELASYRIVRRLSTGNEKDFVLLLKNAAGRCNLAAWTEGETHAVRLDGLLRPKEKVSGVAGGGKPFVPKAVQASLLLELSGMPQYVRLRIFLTVNVDRVLGELRDAVERCRPAALSGCGFGTSRNTGVGRVRATTLHRRLRRSLDGSESGSCIHKGDDERQAIRASQ